MKALSKEAIDKELLKVKDWYFKDEAIEKKFVFKDFNQALGFMVQMGLLCEKMNHHPELFNVYNKITLRLSTHDAKGITEKDFDLAKAINEL